MKIVKNTVIKTSSARNGFRVIFEHEDENSTKYGPYVIHRPTLKDIDVVITNHGKQMEEAYNYVAPVADEKKMLIETLLNMDNKTIEEVLKIDSAIVLKNDLTAQKTAIEAPKEEPPKESEEIIKG